MRLCQELTLHLLLSGVRLPGPRAESGRRTLSPQHKLTVSFLR